MEQFTVVEDTSYKVPLPRLREMWEHGEAAKGDEACGIVGFRDGIAECFVPCANKLKSPVTFELVLPDPLILSEMADDGLDLGVFHTHPGGWAEPSYTDLLNVGVWLGQPYMIMAMMSGELCRWRITRDGDPSMEKEMQPWKGWTPRRKRSGWGFGAPRPVSPK